LIVTYQLAEEQNRIATGLQWLRVSVMAPMVAQRTMAGWFLGFAFVQLVMTFLNRPFWLCPLREGLSFPCPGCGMTRAMLALCKGDWQTAIEMHAFAPLCVSAVVFVLGTQLLSKTKRMSLANRIQQWEQRTGLTGIVVLTLLLYWLLRLVFSEQYFRLVL
jgi:magnesium-transporting ATPase (P-type)